MQKHVQLFRTLKSMSPEMAEELIASWGSADLHVLVHNITSGRDHRIVYYLSPDILRQFAELDQDHRQRFPNLAPPASGEDSGSLALDKDYVLVRQRFPHIADMLRDTWGKSEFLPYMADLMTDARSLKRRGFPKEIMAALTNLDQKHSQLFPQLQGSQGASGAQSEDRIWIDFPSNEN
jgi:hypothetical protein